MSEPLLEYDPWEDLGVDCGGYNSEIDAQAIQILECIRDRKSGKAIAAHTGLSETHVELWQYIFCSAGWCDYGTSPRGCFPDFNVNFDEKIAKFKAYYKRRWEDKQ